MTSEASCAAWMVLQRTQPDLTETAVASAAAGTVEGSGSLEQAASAQGFAFGDSSATYDTDSSQNQFNTSLAARTIALALRRERQR